MRLTVLLLLLLSAAVADAKRVEHLARPRRLGRGDANIVRTDPVDEASWIWAAESRTPQVLRFRCDFFATNVPLELDVSADERYVLLIDGKIIGRGPDRGTVANWTYRSYLLHLYPGRHRLEAVCWRLGEAAPLAQRSWRGGFLLKASGDYDALLTTGRGPWVVGEVPGVSVRADSSVRADLWRVGLPFEFVGNGPYAAKCAGYVPATVVRGPAGSTESLHYGLVTPGWRLFPTRLPPQLEETRRPGSVVAVRRLAAAETNPTYAAADATNEWVSAFNALLAEGRPVTVPPHTRFAVLWDLDDYYCAYPALQASGGRGASVNWGWAESLSVETAAGLRKGRRDEFVGKTMRPYEDRFVADGLEAADFSTLWWRCGRWCQLTVTTADAPLRLEGLSVIESRYPLVDESRFECDDPTIADIRRIAGRAMAMCDHEMLFDCPYYEQQMYPGDTLVQLQVLSVMSHDDRMIKRAIELFDLARREDGLVPMNWPTREEQVSVTYTMCYVVMLYEYLLNHDDFEWLKARLTGMRHALFGIEALEDADGMLRRLPGWSFVDWAEGFEEGCPPASPSSEINLLWVLAQRSAAVVERAIGDAALADRWEARGKRLGSRIVETFWDERRGAIAEDEAKTRFSEHSQALAICTDILDESQGARCYRSLAEDPDLIRATVYFSYHLFGAYFCGEGGDLFLRRLDLWREYVQKGLKTTQEMPDTPARESRSDCHAWGAHPLWFMSSGLAGIRSMAPGFGRVRIAPKPGSLKWLKARHPHPWKRSFIDVDLKFHDGKATGRVWTPVAGEFFYGGETVPLVPGENRIGAGD